jgi:hypothetical protein
MQFLLFQQAIHCNLKTDLFHRNKDYHIKYEKKLSQSYHYQLLPVLVLLHRFQIIEYFYNFLKISSTHLYTFFQKNPEVLFTATLKNPCF